MKKIVTALSMFLLIFLNLFIGCSPKYAEEDEYKEIVKMAKSLQGAYVNKDDFEVTGTCGCSVEMVNGELHIYIIIPFSALEQSGRKDEGVAFYVDNTRLPNFAYYSAGAHENLDKESKDIFLKACELYMTKSYQKSYTANEINNGLK